MKGRTQVARTARSMSGRSAKLHYENHSAESYESSYFYEPGAYMKYLSDLVRERLQLKEGVTTTERRLLDIGGGTGNFIPMIMEDTELVAVAVIDHHLEHQNERVSPDVSDRISFVKASAEALKESHDKSIPW